MISIVLGIAGALAFNIDALPAFGIVGSGLAGEIITGLLASGGSSYIYELLHGAKDIGKDKEDGKKEEKPEEKPEERKKA